MLKLMGTLLSFLALFILPVAAGINVARGEEGIVLREVAGVEQDYCHIKYMAFKLETLGWSQPEFNPDELVDFYGPCSFDPQSAEEIERQLAAARRALSDGDNDAASD
ncbi:MAG: hypothetical protein HY694_11170 [Deltaproteobacteria bacterium]|nr:hypothetical protein [Deltaproteobacteria bacterium]